MPVVGGGRWGGGGTFTTTASCIEYTKNDTAGTQSPHSSSTTSVSISVRDQVWGCVSVVSVCCASSIIISFVFKQGAILSCLSSLVKLLPRWCSYSFPSFLLMAAPLPWLLSLASLPGSPPWLLSLALLPGSSPWLLSLASLPRSSPWLFSLALLPGPPHWIPSLALLPGSTAWIPSLALLPGSTAWIPSLALLPGSTAWLPSLAPLPGSSPWLFSLAPLPGSSPLGCYPWLLFPVLLCRRFNYR